jgi:hypothetical protein
VNDFANRLLVILRRTSGGHHWAPKLTPLLESLDHSTARALLLAVRQIEEDARADERARRATGIPV